MNETITYIQQSLEPLYPPEEIRSLTAWILEKVCNLSRHQQILRKDIQLSCSEKETIKTIIDRLQNSEPIQYVFGETEFYGLSFEVGPAVLIPRPETEELVDRILQDFKDIKDIKDLKVFKNFPPFPTSLFPHTILDIAAGSGCIAITLAKHLSDSTVYALDISDNALQIAKRNAQRNDVSVQFIHADILAANIRHDHSLPQFDVIVSNPPYVTNSEKASIQPNVLDYEPHLALFVPDEDPILFYRPVADFGLEKLTANGLLYLEINTMHSEMIYSILSQKGYRHIEILNDLAGKERFIKASK